MRKILSLVLFSVALAPAARAKIPFGTVKFVRGAVARKNRAVHVGDAVSAGDEISTGPRGMARILLAEGVAMQIGPNSLIAVDSEKGEPTTVSLLKGYLLSKIRKDGDSVKYRVRTKTASLGVRGTTFFAKQETDGRTFLCVCEGTVVASWDKGQSLVTAKRHDAPVWLEAGNPRAAPAPMGNEHTDAEITALDALLH